MEDSEIVQLFLLRDMNALGQIQTKYGAYCMHIAYNVLGVQEDAEECVNDALLKIWHAIPPNRPDDLKAFLARTVRNTALDRLRIINAQKRGGGQVVSVLSELSECASDSRTPESIYSEQELKREIDRFLSSLSARERGIFIRRYYFAENTAQIAAKYGIKEKNVNQTLYHTRKKLKKHLKKEGF